MLYLSILDYPSGWQIAAPSRTFIPELKKRWPHVTSIEVSDHTPLSELDLVRAIAPRYGAVVASVFVRATSGSGRLDLGAELVRLLRDLARITERTNTPFVTTFFGNPVHGVVRAGAAGDAADLRLLRSRRSAPRSARSPARRRSAGRLPISAVAATARRPRLDRRLRTAARRNRSQLSPRRQLLDVLRDRLLARLAEMGDAPDHQRLAAEVLGIRGAPPELARRLVAQALVLEDRRDAWRAAGERICRDAPAAPGVYVLKDADGRALYVGKAVNLRRRLRAHFAERRWRALEAGACRARPTPSGRRSARSSRRCCARRR